jgi:hypothetical protein
LPDVAVEHLSMPRTDVVHGVAEGFDTGQDDMRGPGDCVSIVVTTDHSQ